MIDSMYDVSVTITGVLPPEMHFIYGIITLILSVSLLIVFIAPFIAVYFLVSNNKRGRW